MRGERVLVTDGEQRAALAVVRSLGRRGCDVTVASRSGRSLAGASRYCTREERVPSALTDTVGFQEAVAGLTERNKIDVLLPISEASLLATLAVRERYRDVLIPFPDLDTVRRVTDKAHVLEVASTLGIGVPAQQQLHRAGDLDAVAAELRYPLVVKPARSVARMGRDAVALTVRHAASEQSLRQVLASLPVYAYPVLLQQRIVGPGLGVFLLCWNGQTVAAFGHRRLREKPPSGGVSVYRESVAIDPGLMQASVALLDRMAWQGVAMIEFKVDAATGTPYLMEINGRFWGSLQLAIDAGVDFPALLIDAALGRPPAVAPNYRVGVRSRWWWGDVDHLLAVLRRSRAELSLAADAPSRLRTALAVLTPWRPGDRSEILRLGDPRPFLRESIDWLLRR